MVEVILLQDTFGFPPEFPVSLVLDWSGVFSKELRGVVVILYQSRWGIEMVKYFLCVFQAQQYTEAFYIQRPLNQTQSKLIYLYAVHCNEQCKDLYIGETKQLLNRHIS